MATDKLNSKNKMALKARAHQLHAFVLIGQHGLTTEVIAETNRNLDAHELIKVQVAGDDRAQRIAIAEALCTATGAELIQHIGKQLVLYRQKSETTE
ncbi:ribosome assembly RNA-binding protein YhbY [Snodgrassella communis]|uniref:ribosome assembly RNA-binding protein YhbY n=1 Tax=Snodgrassella communis TaxID=2946699 RepID=UPI001EF5723C|nr:ribosome assembly RNA-binding protein YhbY [Snodgrassella communis]WMY91545.1 ribosome assembly RNA-binding protein YhbY [Snodgrassella communis]